MSKKRVLLVSCGGLGNGGVQAIMMGIVRNLSSEYNFDMLLFTSEKRHYDDEFLSYGGKIIRIPHYEGNNRLLQRIDPYIRDTSIYHKTKKILEAEHSYNIVHCHNEFESAPILKAAFECNVPIRIFHTHVYHDATNIVRTVIDNVRKRIIEKYATDCIGCSIHSNNSIHFKKVTPVLMPNFYNEIKFKYSDIDVAKNYGQLILSQVGAYSPNKNQMFSIKILESLIESGINARLNLIGFDMDINYANQLKDYINLHKLGNIVSLIRGDSDFIPILNESNGLLVPSLSEGFSLSLIEAQAIGLKCFASSNVTHETNCGGVTYLNLNDGPIKWAKEISKWFRTTDGRKQHYDTSNFKTTTVMNLYKNLYSPYDNK
ncbi:MAG: glycosyltransferase [Clostridiales bacterium]|nr:glycosyltransferase [Clostridiales bacterium]